MNWKIRLAEIIICIIISFIVINNSINPALGTIVILITFIAFYAIIYIFLDMKE